MTDGVDKAIYGFANSLFRHLTENNFKRDPELVPAYQTKYGERLPRNSVGVDIGGLKFILSSEHRHSNIRYVDSEGKAPFNLSTNESGSTPFLNEKDYRQSPQGWFSNHVYGSFEPAGINLHRQIADFCHERLNNFTPYDLTHETSPPPNNNHAHACQAITEGSNFVTFRNVAAQLAKL